MFAWVDELAAFRYDDAWDQLMFGLRLGKQPQVMVTTTPRPTKLMRKLLKAPTTVVTKGTTYENIANLSQAFFDQIIDKYQGTRLGRQELLAEILEDSEGALWKREEMIEAYRVVKHPTLARVVVAIDPATTSIEDSSETGIVVAGRDGNGHVYVLEDLSLRASPQKWAEAAVTAYHKYGADRIVAETNQGGDLVEHTIRNVDRSVAYKKVTASRGKVLRAEPIAALYEQGKAHHVGAFPYLEDQMCQWEQGQASPDRLDALVWSLTELTIGLTHADSLNEIRSRLEVRKQHEQAQPAFR